MITRPRILLLAALSAVCCRSVSREDDARGTVEVPEIDLGAMTSARVISVPVEEGATVRAGDTVAVLTQNDLSANLAAQRARLAAAAANLRDLEAGARPEEIRRAEAELSGANAELDRAAKELVRMRDLASRDVVSKSGLDDAISADQVAHGRRDAAEEALRLLRAGSRVERISAARSEVANARAAVAQVEARAGDLVLIAPVGGIVLSRNAEPGEALGPNVPVVTIGEMGRPYVRVFLPQRRVAGVRIGDAVEVLTEDGRSLAARVVAIAPKAEFTPRVALTEQERADLMFGVKVEFAVPAEAPYPGLWVRVRIAGGPVGGLTGGRGDAAR
jgi:HlyD family secretion protein